MAQKHNEQYVNAPMTRLGTIGWPDQDRRVIRSSAFVASKWTAENPILQLGEVGYETDTNKLKVGDGVTKWNDLPYAGDGTGSLLPDQTGHSGEFLTTDGTDASWATVDALPDQTGQSGKFLTTDGTDASWSDKPLVNTATGMGALTLIGTASTSTYAINIGYNSQATATRAIALGGSAYSAANYAIQLGTGNNSTANTFKVGNQNGNFEIMSADGTVPTDRFTTTPTTDGTYVPTLTISSGVATRTWGSGGGGGSLPSQTGNAGKFLTTDGTDASWSDKPLVNKSSSAGGLGVLNSIAGVQAVRIGEESSYQVSKDNVVTVGYKNTAGDTGVVVIGRYASAAGNNNAADSIAIGHFAATTYGGTTSNGAVSIGGHAYTTGNRAIAIGCYANANATGAIQLGTSSTSASTTNSDANTFKVANANGNFELMNANGNLPADRLASTTGLADGNYRLRLVMASGVPTLEWVAE